MTQRCCRWLLQTHDRVDDDTFAPKQEFLAAMLGVHRPTVTVVLRALQRDGLIASRYGRIRSSNESAWRPPPANVTASFAHILYGSGCSARTCRRGQFSGGAVPRHGGSRWSMSVRIAAAPQRRHGMTFASVSMILPLQNGQSVWRVTASVNSERGMLFIKSS